MPGMFPGHFVKHSGARADAGRGTGFCDCFLPTREEAISDIYLMS